MTKRELHDLTRPARISFHAYLRHRKFDYGRGYAASWRFIAVALGDPRLPDATCWKELQEYLQARNLSEDLIEAARTVWRSYQRNAPRESLPPSSPSIRSGNLQRDPC